MSIHHSPLISSSLSPLVTQSPSSHILPFFLSPQPTYYLLFTIYFFSPLLIFSFSHFLIFSFSPLFFVAPSPPRSFASSLFPPLPHTTIKTYLKKFLGFNSEFHRKFIKDFFCISVHYQTYSIFC